MNKLGAKIILAAVLLFLYLPLIILVLYSFNDAQYSLVWHGPTLSWYQLLFSDKELWQVLWHSIVLGLISASVATSLGLFFCVNGYISKRTSKLTASLLLVLIVIPDMVFAVALLVFFNLTGIKLGFTSLLIAHISFCLPFALFSINSRVQTIDKNLYFAAQDLGASYAKSMRTIMIPILWPALLSAFLLSFTLSFDDIIISYFISGPDYQILPLKLYAMIRTGITPEINALSSITFGFSLFLVLFAHHLIRKKEGKNA